MSSFDAAISYVFENEGIDSNDPADAGGRTRFGITAAVAQANGYDVTQLTIDQAREIYRKLYWSFDGINDQRVATKMLDVVVNCGRSGGIGIIQRALGMSQDYTFGPKTEGALNALDPEDAIEKMSFALSDHYVSICIANPTQMVFLKGWERRAIRRPRLASA